MKSILKNSLLLTACCLLLASFWLLAAGFSSANPGGKLQLTISNINPVEGELYIAIYNSEDTYMVEEQTAFRMIVAVESEPQLIIFTDIPAGEYAISVFQDLNSNAELDTKGLGFPAEPFGFSNDARGRFGPPSFEKAKFTHEENTEMKIALVNSKKKN
jgi:uncharacterized protein (DUF2141 family)